MKFPALRLVEATCVPVPLINPLIRLYSIPYAVTAVQPVADMVPAQVAVVCVIAVAPPVVTEGKLFTPAPVAVALIAAPV